MKQTLTHLFIASFFALGILLTITIGLNALLPNVNKLAIGLNAGWFSALGYSWVLRHLEKEIKQPQVILGIICCVAILSSSCNSIEQPKEKDVTKELQAAFDSAAAETSKSEDVLFYYNKKSLTN